MKNKLGIILAAWILLNIAGPLAAEQLTTVAVVDTGKIYTAFFRESAAVRDLERNKQAIQEEINKYANELKKLQSDRLSALSAGSPSSPDVLRLDQEIYNKQQFINDFRKHKQQQLNDQQKSVLQSDSFLGEIAAAIKYIAESDGYTLVIDSATSGLRFWSADVDITNKVLEYLRRNVAR